MAFQFPANPVIGQQYAAAQGTTYEWNGTGWIFLGLNTASLYPAGIVMAYAGATLPFQGWLFCDGKSYATSAQPALFAAIGYTYGGSGANFNVPDLRGRTIAAPDAMGGTVAGRMGGSLSPHATQLAAAGGSEVVTLTADQMPAHSHGITDVAHAHGVNDPTHAHAVYDPSHGHSLNDPSHVHIISDPGHTHGVNDPSHAHNFQRAASNNNQKPASGGTAPFDTYDNGVTNNAGTGISIAHAGTGIFQTTGAGTGQTVNAAGTGIGIYGAGTGIGIAASGSGLSTTNNTGGSSWHFNVQPTLTLNYIIKA